MMQVPTVEDHADLFRITQTDLDRIARRMEHTGLSRTLTALGRQLVRGRLRHGAESGPPVPPVIHTRDQVHVWDPGGLWHVGDHAIIPVPMLRDGHQIYLPSIGEITRIHGNSATLWIDGLNSSSVYGLTGHDHRDPSLDRWREAIEHAVKELRQRSDEVSRVDALMWTRGTEIWSSLLCALRDDARFVTLQGEWFLRSLVVMPSKSELEALARVMLQAAERPWRVADLLPWYRSGRDAGAAGLYGLHMAMQARPDLFTNVDPGPAPRWVLAGPPPALYTARQAAYDPENYELLCEPGDLLSEAVVQRLWMLGLLTAVV
jgi:hypothetical protein